MTHRMLVVAAAATVLAVLVAGCGGRGGVSLTRQTLTFTERQNDDSFSFVDNPPRSAGAGEEPTLSNGDQLTFTADMLDGSGTDVGELDVACAVTATTTGSFDDSRAQCVGTADLPGGSLTLTVGGRAFGARTTLGAVVGGTGDYEGVTGSFTSSDESATGKSSEDTFRLFIPEQ